MRGNMMMWELIPGVIVAVPLPQRWVFAVSCVMASQCISRVVGYCIQVVHNTLCTQRQHSQYLSNPVGLEKHMNYSHLLQTLTAVFWCKLPQVQLFEREVYICGEFAGSVLWVWETFQVWEKHWVKKQQYVFFGWMFLLVMHAAAGIKGDENRYNGQKKHKTKQQANRSWTAL